MSRTRGAIMLLLTVACAEPAPRHLGHAPCDEIERVGGPPDDTSLVIILNDTMRRDAAGVYGGSARTPAFDAFAADSLVFDRAITQAPWTKPAVAALFTSLYPSQHRVSSHPQGRGQSDIQEADVLSDDFVTLAEVLSAAGFRSAAFISNPWMLAPFGFGQGFEHYDDSFAAWGVGGDAVTAAALAWLETLEPGERFFLYLHYLDSHRPYGPVDRAELEREQPRLLADSTPLGVEGNILFRTLRLTDGTPVYDAFPRATRALIELSYDRGIEAFDRALGTFLEGFEGHPAADQAAVIITSDHGEALFTRGYGNHGYGLYDDEAAIPLLARLPGTVAGARRVQCLVGLIDIMPSLCTYLGLDCPASMAGWSFVASPDASREDRRYLVTEGLTTEPTHRSIRNEYYKLMYEPEGLRDGRIKERPYSLFDVDRDPQETRDLLTPDSSTTRTTRVFAVMEEALPAAVPPYAAPARVRRPVDAKLRERLEALGYLDEDPDEDPDEGAAPSRDP